MSEIRLVECRSIDEIYNRRKRWRNVITDSIDILNKTVDDKFTMVAHGDNIRVDLVGGSRRTGSIVKLPEMIDHYEDIVFFKEPFNRFSVRATWVHFLDLVTSSSVERIYRY